MSKLCTACKWYPAIEGHHHCESCKGILEHHIIPKIKKELVMGNNREQIIELKDGRILFKTHNGFKSFVQSKNGEITEITDGYYQASKRVALHALKNK